MKPLQELQSENTRPQNLISTTTMNSSENPYEIIQKGTENVSEVILADSCMLCDETLTLSPEQSQKKINKSLAVKYETNPP